MVLMLFCRADSGGGTRTTAKSTFLEPVLLWLVLLMLLLFVSWLTDHTPTEALALCPPAGDQRGTQSPAMVVPVMFSTRARARCPTSLPRRSLKAKSRRGW